MVSLFGDAALSPTAGQYDWVPNYNFDGIEVVETMADRSFRRTQVYRNGIIEIFGLAIVNQEEGRPVLQAPILENIVLKRAAYALRLLQKLQVQPPVFVGISLLRVNGAFLKFSATEPLKGPIENVNLDFDEVLFDAFDDSLKERLRPLLNIMSQSFGLSKWPS